MQDRSQKDRYLTIDRWDSPESFESFKKQWAQDYARLDSSLEALTKEEIFHGSFIIAQL